MMKNAFPRLAAVLLLGTSACSIQTRAPEAAQSVPVPPPSASAAPTRLASSPRHGEWVKVASQPGSRDSIMAWVVYPSTTNAKSPVVVIIHEIYGLQTWVRAVADQMAAEGFIAIAPDFLSRPRGGPSTVELARDSATKLQSQVNYAERMRIVTAVANYGMSLPSAAQSYGVIGFCWGGSTTFAAAVHNGKGFNGGVAFYGNFPYMANNIPVADSVKKISAPVMLLNGSKDVRIGASMPVIDSTMKAHGKWYEGKNYEGAVHGFARAQDDPKATRDVVEEQANLAAIKDAWPKTIDFLRKNLTGK